MALDYTIIFHLYTWILISLMILIMGSIGRFYQMKFQYRTSFPFMFLIAIVLSMSVLLHIFNMDYRQVEFIEMLGVLTAAILSIRLYRVMTGAG